MKKSFLKFRPLHEKMQPFQRSPIYQIKLQPKPEQNRLKKIGRNKLQFKQSFLPKLNITKNKQNQASTLKVSASAAQLNQTKIQSFIKLDRMYPEHKLNKMAHSQKLDNEPSQQSRIKELAIKKQFFIREKKMLIQRNCISADMKKENKENLPPSIRSIRQKLYRKQSQVDLQSQNLKSLKLSDQAKQMAMQMRPMTCPNASKNSIRSPSLQDFLNNWIWKP